MGRITGSSLPELRSPAQRPVADPVAWPGSECCGAVVWVGELTAAEREAAAADALGEPELETFELGDSLVDPRAPGGRESGPVAARRGLVGRKLGELEADLF